MFLNTNIFVKYFFVLGVLFSFWGYGQRKKPFQYFLEHLDTKKYHWGFYLGLQHYGYDITYKDQLQYSESIVSIPNSNAFNVGFVAGWRINRYVALRVEPGFITGGTEISFMNPVLNKGTKLEPIFPKNKILINEVRLPFYVKLNGIRYGNIRPFVMLGGVYGYNFSNNKTSEEDNKSGVFRASSHNLSYEFGVGIDFYTPYFKFSPVIKGFYTTNNQLTQDIESNSPYTSYLSQIKSRGIFISLYFE